MAGKLEAAKNYLQTVAERSIGAGAIRTLYSKDKLGVTTPPTIAGKIGKGLIVGGVLVPLQFCFPLSYRGLEESKRQFVEYPNAAETNPDLTAVGFLSGAFVDLATNFVALSIAQHNPIGAAEFRLGANVASNVAADIAERAVDRIRHFKPSDFLHLHSLIT